MKETKILLAEDHGIVRKGIRNLINDEKGLIVLGEAENGREAVKLAECKQPDIVIMDISMPVLNGIEATKRIINRCEETKVLILTRHTNEEYIMEVIDAGASGYIDKHSVPRELISAIRAAIRDEKYFSPSVSSTIVETILKNDGGDSSYRLLHSDLTSREKEVLQLIAEGNKNSEIAQLLSISQKTVETHRTHLMDKLDLHNIADLTKYAIKTGIIDLDGDLS